MDIARVAGMFARHGLGAAPQMHWDCPYAIEAVASTARPQLEALFNNFAEGRQRDVYLGVILYPAFGRIVTRNTVREICAVGALVNAFPMLPFARVDPPVSSTDLKRTAHHLLRRWTSDPARVPPCLVNTTSETPHSSLSSTNR